MPKYLGPYDTLVEGGKEYHRGDNVPAGKERLEQLRAQRLQFEGDEQTSAVPVLADQPDEPHAPTPQGVPEAPKS